MSITRNRQVGVSVDYKDTRDCCWKEQLDVTFGLASCRARKASEIVVDSCFKVQIYIYIYIYIAGLRETPKGAKTLKD
jgi:hypothetical protein